MKSVYYVKNMVCNRCKTTVVRELSAAGYAVDEVELGRIVLRKDANFEAITLEKVLKQHGFELIKEDLDVLIEQLKIVLIGKIEAQDRSNLSDFLPTKFNKSYTVLSKIFSKHEGITLEKYEINLKIEKVKELIQLGQLNFSEIAAVLHYSNSGHLARQFKNTTGMSMTDFKSIQLWNRKSLDQIV